MRLKLSKRAWELLGNQFQLCKVKCKLLQKHKLPPRNHPRKHNRKRQGQHKPKPQFQAHQHQQRLRKDNRRLRKRQQRQHGNRLSRLNFRQEP